MANKINTKWFKDSIKDRGKSQADLATFLELDTSAVSLILNGRRKLQLDVAEQIARFINKPTEEVLRQAGLQSIRETADTGAGERRIQITGAIDLDGKVRFSAPTGASAPAPGNADPDTVAVRMEGGFAPGAAILFVPSKQVEADAIGRLSAVTLQDGSTVLGIPTAGYDRGHFNVSLPRSNMENAQITAATPVLWIRP